MKVVITGCSGFIGYNLTKSLLIGGAQVLGIDNYLDNHYLKTKKERTKFLKEFPNFKFTNLDITKDSFPYEFKKADYTVHLAAKDYYYEDKEQKYSEYIEHNVVGSTRVFEWSRDLGVKKFIFSSTHSVYGDTKKEVFTEKKIVPKPISPHGASKLSAEHAINFLSRTYDVPSIILRVSTVYGPDMLAHQVIPYLIENIYKKNNLKLHVSPNTTRDFVYVDDVVDAIKSCFNKRLTLQTINIASGKAYSIKEVADEISKILHKKHKKIVFEKSRVEHIDKVTSQNVRLSIARAKKLLNFEPKVSLQEGLERSIDWYFEHNKIKKAS